MSFFRCYICYPSSLASWAMRPTALRKCWSRVSTKVLGSNCMQNLANLANHWPPGKETKNSWDTIFPLLAIAFPKRNENIANELSRILAQTLAQCTSRLPLSTRAWISQSFCFFLLIISFTRLWKFCCSIWARSRSENLQKCRMYEVEENITKKTSKFSQLPVFWRFFCLLCEPGSGSGWWLWPFRRPTSGRRENPSDAGAVATDPRPPRNYRCRVIAYVIYVYIYIYTYTHIMCIHSTIYTHRQRHIYILILTAFHRFL